MVGLTVVVQDESGYGISGIPVQCYVTNSNPANPFAPSKYWIHLPNTSADGSSFAQNVQGYATFKCYANKDQQIPNYTEGTGTTSTTLTSGGFTKIILKQVVTPLTNPQTGQLTCPSGYILSGNQCIQGTQTESITTSFIDWINSHMIDFVIGSISLAVIAFIAFYFLRKHKGD
ncbi:MAG: hypothetical protein QXV17_12720 [Candidatus Micrarchaeaceae archaeon]